MITRTKRSAEELSRQLDALALENARLLNKIQMLEKNVMQMIYKAMSQRKKRPKKRAK